MTQAPAPQTGVLTNPPLIAGQVPGIAATNSGKIVGVPITTPPETPKASFSAPSAGASAGTKRETNDGEAVGEAAGNQPKRRRIAPTLVSSSEGSGGDDKKDGKDDEAKAA